MCEILKYFPKQISEILYDNINKNYDSLEEIRLRIDKPIILKFFNTEILVPYYINREEIIKTLQILCDNSIYSYQSQICSRIYNNKGRT